MTANTTSFKPGVSGNPSGRKPDKEIKELARGHTEAAIKTLAEIMRAKKASGPARVAAAVALLDRGWGKPPIDVAVHVDPLTELTLEHLTGLIALAERHVVDGAADPAESGIESALVGALD